MKVEFKKEWGGEDTVFTKARRWADKQRNPLMKQVVRGVIEWLWGIWVDGRVRLEMSDIDKQVEEMMKEWDESEKWSGLPVYEEWERSEVVGLDVISIGYELKNEEDVGDK